MGYADLIANKVAELPANRQAEVLRYVEAVAGELGGGAQGGEADAILHHAWGAWGQAAKAEIDRALAAQRDEWERETRTDA
ncbi:MAG: hypothetical protein HZC24_04970 [Rhodocyclales bacterium]|nr:hypothetical protein [Rhodocyclales bacterium]